MAYWSGLSRIFERRANGRGEGLTRTINEGSDAKPSTLHGNSNFWRSLQHCAGKAKLLDDGGGFIMKR